MPDRWRISCWAWLLPLWLGLMPPALASDALRVLAWPGYADPDVVRAFEQRTGRRVVVTEIDSDQALWQRLSEGQGKDFDVFAVNTAELQRYLDVGWLLPIDAAAIPNRARQLPRFRELASIPGLQRAGKTYGVPYAHAEMGLIYDRQQVARAPDSIKALWDPRYRGKVLAYSGGTHNITLAAQSLGLADPFRLGAGDWPRVAEQLQALRRNVLTFYTQPDESVRWFLERKAMLMLANYGAQQVQLLRQAGADVGYAIPREGALAWLDCWVITHGVRDQALAERWIDFLLEDMPGRVLSDRHGLANTTEASSHYRPRDLLRWLEPVEDVDRRNLVWERVLSGYRGRKVLVP